MSHANQKSTTLIDGRAIYNLGLNSLKHCKKALAFEKQFLGPDGNLPSGTNVYDLNNFILEGMYKSLKSGTIDTIIAADEDKIKASNNNNNTSERPYDWTFPGWIAYKLFGPRADRAYRSPLLLIGDWPNNKRDGAKTSGGRSGAREDQAIQHEMEWLLDSTNTRGIPLGASKKDILLLAQSEDAAEQRNHESKILAMSAVIDSLHKRVDVYTKLLVSLGSNDSIMNKIEELMMEISAKEALMGELSNKKRKVTHSVELLFQNNKSAVQPPPPFPLLQ